MIMEVLISHHENEGVKFSLMRSNPFVFYRNDKALTHSGLGLLGLIT